MLTDEDQSPQGELAAGNSKLPGSNFSTKQHHQTLLAASENYHQGNALFGPQSDLEEWAGLSLPLRRQRYLLHWH